MNPEISHAKFWSLTSTQRKWNDNNEEQQYFLKGCVCLFIYHTITINFPRPRSSIPSYKLPKKKYLPTFSYPKTAVKPPKILATFQSLEIESTPPGN